MKTLLLSELIHLAMMLSLVAAIVFLVLWRAQGWRWWFRMGMVLLCLIGLLGLASGNIFILRFNYFCGLLCPKPFRSEYLVQGIWGGAGPDSTGQVCVPANDRVADLAVWLNHHRPGVGLVLFLLILLWSLIFSALRGSSSKSQADIGRSSL